MSFPKSLPVLILVTALVSVGCSDGRGGLVSPDGGGGSSGADATPIDASDTEGGGDGSLVDSSGTDALADASSDAMSCGGTICGGTCCPSSKSCVQGACLDPCSGTRCGDDKKLCCTGQDVCLGESCVTPGEKCDRTEDCKVGEICEPTLGRCVPRDKVEVCEYKPPEGKFTPQIDCNWTPDPNDPYPKRGETEAAPTVVNMTDDNGDGKTDTKDIPDLVFLSDDHGPGCCNNPSTIRIVSGKCNKDGSMDTLGSISKPVTESSGGLAVGDLTGNGVPEIVAITRIQGKPQGVAAWTRTKPDGSKWKLLWHNKTYPTWNKHTRGGGLISIADLEADGTPDIIVGNVALNGRTGKLKWDGYAKTNGNGGVGNNAFLGPSSAVADVDLDGKREVAAGNTLYDHDGTPLWTYSYQSNNSPCQGALPCDGFDAFADFDQDKEGEVVIVRRGIVYILNHDGSLMWKQPILKDDCKENESGPPTVADFDGDGQPEIGTAAADFYTVLDPECDANPVPGKCKQRGILWATPNQDCSSRVTASSVFDFEGDGKAEMVYADEQNFYILDGQTGKILHRDTDHRSNTRIEMPLVADVDNDGNSEVVIPAPYGPNSGISILADKDDNWVRTRRIWNQHGYSVTNVEEDGTIPTQPRPNWRNGRLNHYRQNQQPAGVFDAPDVAVSAFDVSDAQCVGERSVDISVTIENKGALGMPTGVPVHLSVTHKGSTMVIKKWKTSSRLLPGQDETLTHTWTIPNGWLKDGFTLEVHADPTNVVNECPRMNNKAQVDASKEIELKRPALVVKSVGVDDSTCADTGEVQIDVTVENTGMASIPKDIPVAIRAVKGGFTRDVKTVKTSGPLSPGQTESFSMTWPVTSRFMGSTFDVKALIDPDQKVLKCDKTNEGSTGADCTFGG